MKQQYCTKMTSNYLEISKLLLSNVKCCNTNLNSSSDIVFNLFDRENYRKSIMGK